MADNGKFYNVSDYGNRIDPGERLNLELRMYANRDTEAIAPLTALPLEQLQTLREGSAAAEQAIFDNLRESARAWEAQAAQTLLVNMAIEYARIPAVEHTSNQWEKGDYDRYSISNMVYRMNYNISTSTHYDRAQEKSIPYAWHVSWNVNTNSPDRRSNSKIAGQYQKRYGSMAEAEKYLAGRIKAYSHLFTEISPALPQEYAKHFKVNGQLLPGYTVEGIEPSPPVNAADIAAAIARIQTTATPAIEPNTDIASTNTTDHNPDIPTEPPAATHGGDSISAQTKPRKERDTMNDPISIKISSPENADNSVWLKLPATAEQFDIALERIGAQDGKFNITELEPGIHLSAEHMDSAKIGELNHLAAILEDFDEPQTTKLNAIISIMPDPDNINSIIGHAHNIDFHEHYPDITTHAQLGEHVFNNSGLIQIPEEWAAAVDREKLGQLSVEHERGIFTEQGYIVESGKAWEAVPEVIQDYRLSVQIDNANIPSRAPGVAAEPPAQTAATSTPAQANAATNTQPTADPTKEQTATTAAAVTAAPFILKADNPRDKMKEITDKLENGIKSVFESEQYKNYLNTLSKFHNYSLRNTLLIAMQKPDATRVAGFNAWKKDFKRDVQKDEKGIKIIAPAPFKAKKSVDKLDSKGKPIIGKDGKRVKEEKEITVPAFTVVTVFDVSQTEGEPLPKLATELTGSVDKYKEFFAAVEKTSPVPVDFEKITTGAKGYFHLEDKRIVINEGMSELQSVKTLIHEIAHARIHDIDKNTPKDVPRVDSRTREVEAESIAYTVCQHYGLDTSDYSFGYIAGWSGGKQLDVLQSSLDTIRKAADSIITEVDKHFVELTKDMEQTIEQTAEHTAPQNIVTDHAPTPELQAAMQGLQGEVKETLQFFIDEDMKNHGELRPGTLEMIAVQGFELKDGKLAEAPPVNSTFSIYQLKDGNETRDIRFEPLDSLKQAPDIANYNHIYTAPLKHGDTPDRIFMEFNHDKSQDFTGHSLSVSDVVVINNDGKEAAFYVDRAGFKELPGFVAAKEPAKEAPAAAVDLKVVADYLQKQNSYAQGTDPNSQAAGATVNIVTRRLEQTNERIPDQHPQLKALLANAAQSPDLPTLKERMNTLHNDFIKHYSTAVQNTVDMSGKAEPPAAPSAPAPATKPPAHGENVAAIEARVKAGETINLTDLSNAIKDDKKAAQAAQSAQPGKSATGKNTQNRTYSQGKSKTTTNKQKQPSIKEQLAAGKKQLSGNKPTPQKTATKNKNAELGG